MRAVLKMVDPAIEIISASDGDEALAILRSDPKRLPKVILLDLKMPKKTGHEILSELKADHALKRIPVCMFSNGDSEADIRESYEHGASFYFKKPAGLVDLKVFFDENNNTFFQ
jgi:DNA-binding response OmpR family regulator